jgi:hypothetical protein
VSTAASLRYRALIEKTEAAPLQDRDGTVAVLASIHFLYPWRRHVFCRRRYAGGELRAALTMSDNEPSRSSSVPIKSKASAAWLFVAHIRILTEGWQSLEIT